MDDIKPFSVSFTGGTFRRWRQKALIAELGITDPSELDIEAIAFDSGVQVAYEVLTGCEATLIGCGNHAIATINPSSVRGRERFSVAHELGHWHLHRGRSFRCRVDEVDVTLATSTQLEKDADTFAAHLLLPGALFCPVVRSIGEPTLNQLAEIGRLFETSIMATALRLVNVNTLPVIVACYNRSGRRWSVPALDVPKRWFLKKTLDEDTFTYDLLHEGKECSGLRKQSADAWFDNSDAENFTVKEHCIASRDGEALVILHLEPSMMEAGPDWNVTTRKYNEYGSYMPRGRT